MFVTCPSSALQDEATLRAALSKITKGDCGPRLVGDLANADLFAGPLIGAA